ncbi:class I SAM-dependent methyltransferase [Streptomyces sp. 5-8]|uniref:Class I SAM-dependent methyltransferase n=1 Tax=Streptomyces musisoli TaxID=2802280 RepID=A0ABS1PAL2_9ACTN|nr:class I SAM-dependent methyltransferase [Streptomyces musisoli]MBL1109415.1 class I SAM-dependent methyltransferase [Streptomyces musisoli]
MADVQLSVVERQLGAVYDAMHAARAGTTIVGDLYGQAMGDLYPVEVDASSCSDWALLGSMVANLRMRPGQRLVDVGCGTGGVGLWLARALAVSVSGVDVSATALSLAIGRAGEFGLPVERVEFRVGSLGSTGLPAQFADGLVCVDALGHEKDRRRALEEIRRVLRPGARAVLTSGRSRVSPALPPWSEQAQGTGLILEAEEERPHEPVVWQRVYRSWVEHEAGLREQLGHAQVDSMLTEARTRGPELRNRVAVIVTLRRPEV